MKNTLNNNMEPGEILTHKQHKQTENLICHRTPEGKLIVLPRVIYQDWLVDEDKKKQAFQWCSSKIEEYKTRVSNQSENPERNPKDFTLLELKLNILIAIQLAVQQDTPFIWSDFIKKQLQQYSENQRMEIGSLAIQAYEVVFDYLVFGGQHLVKDGQPMQPNPPLFKKEMYLKWLGENLPFSLGERDAGQGFRSTGEIQFQNLNALFHPYNKSELVKLAKCLASYLQQRPNEIINFFLHRFLQINYENRVQNLMLILPIIPESSLNNFPHYLPVNSNALISYYNLNGSLITTPLSWYIQQILKQEPTATYGERYTNVETNYGQLVIRITNEYLKGIQMVEIYLQLRNDKPDERRYLNPTLFPQIALPVN